MKQEELLEIIEAFYKKNGVYPYTTQLIDLGYFKKQRLSLLVQDLIKRKVISIQHGEHARQLTIK